MSPFLYEPVREGEPVRFSLASPEPLPAGLLAHTRHVFSSACKEVAERSPEVPGLQTLSLFGVAKSDAAALELLRDELRGPALALGVDCALTRGKMAERGPRLIVSDVDSTFIRGEAIDMLADAVGSGPRVAAITEAAMNGELDFAESLAERVATLAGLPVDRVESIADRIEPVPGAATLVTTAHARGCAIGLVSGGFIEVIGGMARRLGVDHVLANRLETSGGTLTGRTKGEIVTRERKAEALRRWSEGGSLPGADLPGGSKFSEDSILPEGSDFPLEDRARESADSRSGGGFSRSGGFSSPRMRIDLSETVAAGDGANDLSMMEIAGLSVAVCAKPAVLAAADAAVTQPRLDILTAILGWDAV